MATNSHAFLSPSAAHRWMNCPAAPGLEAEVPDKGSIFAEEGSLAHAICEAKLRAELSGYPPKELYYQENNCKVWTDHELYHPEMEEHTDYYHDVVWNKLEKARETTPDAKLIIEQTLEFRTWIPDGFGTADAIIIADGTMEVIDFKYGKGVQVEATENPQMMIYALGALEEFDLEYDIKQVRMTIVQPRLDHVSEYEIGSHELYSWGKNVLKPAAEYAFKKPEEQHAGTWCKFCAVKNRCKKLAAYAQETSSDCQDPKLMSNEDIAILLPKLAIIKSWCSDIEAFALEQAIEGANFPGYKLVEGRSIRIIAKPEEIVEKMKSLGFNDDAIFKPRELQTISALEKLVGKKKFGETMESAIVKPQGKPTLVPVTDKRKELSSAASDFEGIIVD